MPVETTLYSLSDGAPRPDGPERRDGERHLTLFRVGSVTIADRRELCLIKNISAGGMRIRAYCAMPVGTELSVELKHGRPVSGKVAWTEGNQVGIAFDQPVDVLDLLATAMDGPRPRMPRIEVRCPMTVRVGGEMFRVTSSDISQGGIKLLCNAPLPVGADVVVSLPGLEPQPGVIRWNESGACGITFNRLIPLSALVAWLQAQRESLRATG